MNTNETLRITPRLIVGLGILLLGLLWTLDNLDFIEADQLMEWWPLIIVLAGVARLANPQCHRLGSVLLIAFGTVLLLDSIDVTEIDLGDLFPLLIVAVGAKIIWDALGRRAEPSPSSRGDADGKVNAFALMAGIHRQSTSAEFLGGEVSAIMGGVELDLRHAKIPEGQEAIIDSFAMWGGVEIRVPDHWRVRGNVMPLLGGFDDKTRPTGESGPVLTVRGTAIMGGIEVKN